MDAVAFIKALENLAKEKNIKKEVIFDAMELALATAYRKNFNSLTNVRVDINRETGEIKVFSFQNVVKKINEEEPVETQILLKDAKKKIATIEVGETIEEEVTPKDFGRVATATAKQVIMQKVREAERESIMEEFSGKEEELLVGTLSREDATNYYIDLGRSHGILPKTEIIPGENIKMGSSIKVYVTKIDNSGKGPLILLSRTHYGFVKRLLELEIPELADGSIMLYSVAREAGNRSKIAVFSENKQIDPIGACIGEKGSRINRLMQELNGEKIDIILYDKEPVKFIANALSPARDLKVYLTDPKNNQALVVADGDNLSLAIGKRGQNVRLAARLTRYRIDVKTTEQVREEGINLYKFEGGF